MTAHRTPGTDQLSCEAVSSDLMDDLSQVKPSETKPKADNGNDNNNNNNKSYRRQLRQPRIKKIKTTETCGFCGREDHSADD